MGELLIVRERGRQGQVLKMKTDDEKIVFKHNITSQDKLKKWLTLLNILMLIYLFILPIISIFDDIFTGNKPDFLIFCESLYRIPETFCFAFGDSYCNRISYVVFVQQIYQMKTNAEVNAFWRFIGFMQLF